MHRHQAGGDAFGHTVKKGNYRFGLDIYFFVKISKTPKVLLCSTYPLVLTFLLTALFYVPVSPYVFAEGSVLRTR